MDHAILGFHDEFYNCGADQVRIASQLPVLAEFRTQFHYNNFMYGVVGEVIQAVCKRTLGEVMREKIFEPLELKRTCTNAADYSPDGNIAQGYSILDDGSAVNMGDTKMEDGSAYSAAGFVRSSVGDMLRWAAAVMRSMSHPSVDEVLPGIAITRAAYQPITLEPVEGENQYGLGWFRHTIPSRWLGSISPNFVLLPDPPVIGQDGPPLLTICHYGAFGGFLSAFYTFPDTQSAIVVLGNSSAARGDPTDLIAQSLCQALFDMQPRVPLELFAARAAETSGLIWPALVRSWVLTRSPSSCVPALADFTGRYTHPGLSLRIDVAEYLSRRCTGSNGARNERLVFAVNGLPRQTAKLLHYHQDTWSFLPNSRDDAVKKGMELYMSLPLVLLTFGRDASGRVRWLEWDLFGGEQDGPEHQATYNVKPVRFEKIDC